MSTSQCSLIPSLPSDMGMGLTSRVTMREMGTRLLYRTRKERKKMKNLLASKSRLDERERGQHNDSTWYRLDWTLNTNMGRQRNTRRDVLVLGKRYQSF